MLDAAAVKDVGGAEARRIRMGPGAANEGHCDNSIHTAKYNVLTFVPIFLFTMFSRVAYLYFLCQVGAAARITRLLDLQEHGFCPTQLLCYCTLMQHSTSGCFIARQNKTQLFPGVLHAF